MNKCKYCEYITEVYPGYYQSNVIEQEVPMCHNKNVNSKYCFPLSVPRMNKNQELCKYFEELKK